MPDKHFEFGPFRLNPTDHLLTRGEEPVQLPPKAFETLVLLVEKRGHVLQKSALMEALWPDSFVEESNLTQNIFLVRKALGEDGEQQYVKTIPRVGYRFMMPVREIVDANETVLVESHTRERIVIKEQIVEREEETDDETAAVARMVGARSFVRSPAGIATLIIALSALLLATVLAVSHFSSANTSASAARNGMPADNAAAREAYRNGRALWNKRTSASVYASFAQFQQAIAKDPNFALAYVGLADGYAFDSVRWHESEALAKKALDLDKMLGEAHATLGFIRTFWEWDWKSGEREFRRAIELKPEYATAHQWYAIHLAVNGRLVEGEVEIRRALELDPNSAPINADVGQILYFERKYDEAISACQRALEIDPDFYNAHQYLYEIYCQKGLGDQAFAEVVKLEQTSGAGTAPFTDEARMAYQKNGLRGFWLLRMQKQRMLNGSHYDVAEAHARLGQKDEALSELEQAWHKHDFNMVFLCVNPAFLSLHADPRFVKLQGQMWTLPFVL